MGNKLVCSWRLWKTEVKSFHELFKNSFLEILAQCYCANAYDSQGRTDPFIFIFIVQNMQTEKKSTVPKVKNCKNARKYKAKMLQLSAFTMTSLRITVLLPSSAVTSALGEAKHSLHHSPTNMLLAGFGLASSAHSVPEKPYWRESSEMLGNVAQAEETHSPSLLAFIVLEIQPLLVLENVHSWTCSLTQAETLLYSQVLKQPQGWPGNSLAFCTYTPQEDFVIELSFSYTF